MFYNADTHDRIYDEEQQPLVGDLRDGDVNVCECFDREVINVHPRVVFAFIVTLSILSTCAALLVIRPEWEQPSFPIMTTLCGLWVPSPAQAAGRMSHTRH